MTVSWNVTPAQVFVASEDSPDPFLLQTSDESRVTRLHATVDDRRERQWRLSPARRRHVTIEEKPTGEGRHLFTATKIKEIMKLCRFTVVP